MEFEAARAALDQTPCFAHAHFAFGGIDTGEGDNYVWIGCGGVEYLFKKHQVTWIKGTARLTGGGHVDVFEGDKRSLHARKEIVLATGSAPRSVPGIDIDRRRIITSDEAVNLREVPSAIVIAGCGAVGCSVPGRTPSMVACPGCAEDERLAGPGICQARFASGASAGVRVLVASDREAE